VADDNSTQDWVVDCDRKGRERVERDGRDSRVAMMAVEVEDGSGKQ
jgi:hypothetical protein